MVCMYVIKGNSHDRRGKGVFSTGRSVESGKQLQEADAVEIGDSAEAETWDDSKGSYGV